jgi:hypothetical protein
LRQVVVAAPSGRVEATTMIRMTAMTAGHREDKKTRHP